MAELMRTSNPVLDEKLLRASLAWRRNDPQGTVNKTGILLLCAMASAAWTWHLLPIAFGCRRHALVVDWDHRRICLRTGHGFQEGMVCCHRAAYALLEGLALGASRRFLSSASPELRSNQSA